MSDKKKKTDKKPGKSKKEQRMELEASIKESHRKETAVRNHWKAQRSEMTNGRKDSLQASMSTRGKAIGELKRTAEAEKATHKAVLTDARAAAEATYEDAVKTAVQIRDSTIAEAKKVKEEACGAITRKLHDDSAPIIETHKADVKEVESDFVNEMAAIDTAEAKALAEVQKARAELEKRLEKLQPPPAPKKETEGEKAEAAA
jgi:hypothetical protein